MTRHVDFNPQNLKTGQPDSCAACENKPTRPYSFQYGIKTAQDALKKTYTTAWITVHLCEGCVQQQRRRMISQVVIAFAIGIGLLILSRLLASWGVAPENANFFRDVGIFAFLIGGLLIWDTKLGRNLNFVGSRRALRLNEKNLKEQGYTQFWEDKREVGSPAK